jgi:transposase
MRTAVRLRTLTAEEVTQVRRLANSRKAAARLVQRARLITFMLDDPNLYAGDAGLKAGFRTNGSGAMWVRRFNEAGVAGLEDKPRPGRQPTHSPEVRGQLVALAIQKPGSLGYPFELWTLERLQRAFEERHGVHLSDSTIWEWLAAEGLEWKRQQSWFHDVPRHDPEFVEKRGPSSPPT